MNDILDPDYCPDAAEYERLVRAGKRYEADKFAADRVREGSLSKRMREIVADIVDPDVKRRRGRQPGSHLDPIWHNIGRDFDDLISNGIPPEKAYDALAGEHNIGKRTIQNMVRDYQNDLRKSYEQFKAWEEDFKSWTAEEQDRWYREIEQAQRDAVEDTLPGTGTSEIDEYEEWVGDSMNSCPHNCKNGCRRSTLENNRYLCLFSLSARKKFAI